MALWNRQLFPKGNGDLVHSLYESLFEENQVLISAAKVSINLSIADNFAAAKEKERWSQATSILLSMKVGEHKHVSGKHKHRTDTRVNFAACYGGVFYKERFLT